MSQLLSNVMGVATIAHTRPSEREYIFERVQDVEPILELNKAVSTMEQKRDWGRHVGRVPNIIIERWLKEENDRGNPIRYLGPGFDDLIRRKLADPDNRAWRVDNPSNPFYLGWRNVS